MLKRFLFKSAARPLLLGSAEGRLRDPYYRFQSVAEVTEAARLGVKLDVNQAGVDDWLRLPGLSIHQARLLVGLTQNGVQFYALEDVARALAMPVQRLQPLAVILQFCYYDRGCAQAVTQVHLNSAGLEQLIALPGMTPSLARGMIRDRILHGPYKNIGDLQQRLTLSGSLIQDLLPYLRF